MRLSFISKITLSWFSSKTINSEIDFSNNKINIVKAVGYANNAPIIARGHIDKNVDLELLMNKVELKYLCPKEFGIDSGIASLIANFTGPLGSLKNKINLSVENLKLSNNNINLSLETAKIDTSKNNIAYLTNLRIKSPISELIKVPSMKLLFNSENIKIPVTNVYMPNSLITLKGDFSNYNNNIGYLLTIDVY